MYVSKEIQAKLLLYSPIPSFFPEVTTINWLVCAIPGYCFCMHRLSICACTNIQFELLFVLYEEPSCSANTVPGHCFAEMWQEQLRTLCFLLNNIRSVLLTAIIL